MLILGIESSCDETGAAIIEGINKSSKVKLLSNTLASSLVLHSKTGGIIPESAAREQVKYIIPVIKETLEKAKLSMNEIDAIAVTYGPGLIGSLLVGVETAKALALSFDKPIIPVNHLLGHIYANFIEEDQKDIEFPAVSLIVSGGHTDLLLIESHGKIKWLGGTRDDAAGEALDKIGRILGLPYPGGPHIEKVAKTGDPKVFNFPRPLIGSPDFDFSFSGLKTAVFRESGKVDLNDKTVSDISAAVQNVILDVLITKTIRAAEKYSAKSVLLGGGVAANQKLRDEFSNRIQSLDANMKLFVPSRVLCTDNGAMIAACAFYNYQDVNWRNIDANPSLYFQ
jgi:N6-L-threonylcarbamoyladenine synthase